MLLRYDGHDAKFTAYGFTWTPGDILDVDLPDGEIAWLTRHGLSVILVPKQQVPVAVVVPPPPVEPENILDPLPRRRGRGRHG